MIVGGWDIQRLGLVQFQRILNKVDQCLENYCFNAPIHGLDLIVMLNRQDGI